MITLGEFLTIVQNAVNESPDSSNLNLFFSSFNGAPFYAAAGATMTLQFGENGAFLQFTNNPPR